MPGRKPHRQLEAAPQTHLDRARKQPAVFLATEREIPERCVYAQGRGPVDSIDEFRYLPRIVPRGIHPANQAAHAGACDIVDRNAVFLQPANDTGMRQADSAAPGKYESDLWTFHRLAVLAVCGSTGREHC